MNKSDKKAMVHYLEKQIKLFLEDFNSRKSQDAKCVYKLLITRQNNCFAIIEFLYSFNIISFEQFEEYCSQIYIEEFDIPDKCIEECQARTPGGYCEFDLRPCERVMSGEAEQE